MSSLTLDTTTGDLVISGNTFPIIDGADAVAQHLKCRFQLFLGEWFLDTRLGVPYFQEILVKGPSFAAVSEILKKVALETPGVTEVTIFEVDYDGVTRLFSLHISAMTTDGPIDFSQEVAFPISTQ